MRDARVTALAAVLLSATACSVEPTGETPPETVPSLQAMLESGERPTLHTEYLRLTRLAPGFAGVFFDQSGQLTINVATDSFSSHRVAIVRDWARRHTTSAFGFQTAQLRRVSYSYDFLDSLFSALAPRLRGLDLGIRSWGLDEARNFMFFSVVKQSGRREILRLAAAAGIPSRAIQVQVEPDVHMKCLEDCGGGGGGGGGGSPPPLTLFDYVRPVNGGLLISGAGYCTLGFTGYSSGSPRADVFLTAGHCNTSGMPGTMDSTVFGQGEPNYPRIGREFQQPALMPTSDPHCLWYGAPPINTTHCAFADVLVGRVDDSVTAGYGVVEKTAERTSLPPPLTKPVITGITGTVGNIYGALTGDSVWMVGAFSGTQRGVIVNSCVNVTTNQYPTIYILCAGRASYCSQGGDSGAPVFMPYRPGYAYESPREVGIHFAGFANCGGAFYNNAGGIFNAIGTGYLW